MNAYERREALSKLLVEQPMTTTQMGESLHVDTAHIRNDLRILIKRGIVFQVGWAGTMRTFNARRVILAAELMPKPSAEKASKQFSIDNIPECLHMMYGYTKQEPKGGRFVDNADFHPTPTRVAPHKVHIGNAWGQMLAMAL
jgi:predicted transcriptional regulator